MFDVTFKTFCPSNYCMKMSLDKRTCVFIDDVEDTLPVIMWNGEFSPLSLDEMRQGGYHTSRCTKPCK